MIETVDQLIALLQVHRGKPLMIEDIDKSTLSHIIGVADENGTCVLMKSIRDYPKEL